MTVRSRDPGSTHRIHDVMQMERAPELDVSVRLRRNMLLIRAGILVLLVVFWGGGSSAAWASCGDYVTIDSPDLQHSQVRLVDSGRIYDALSDSHARPSIPCHGPECRQRRQSVPPAPVPVTVVQRIEYAVLADLPRVEPKMNRHWRKPEADAIRRRCPATGIERPPRSL